ncbi:hypothetical protein [Streptomyces sp. 5-10]|uniref:hypothetical protein n=1 Tax=Streptomyces sp. 5-10 TaxID=878925 RepID=UPI00168B0D8C|nr:hypothetical protein [Streptomyces sp. 5-10]MBD3006486.1 hypothetical protein [Streptomyces sp. 5-10]
MAEQEDRSLTLSTAGAAALARCQEQPSVAGQGAERSPADLLVAILDDPSCAAVSYLNGCGVDVVALRQAVRLGQVPVVEDAVPPELRSTRDALVGRRRYKPRELGQFWTTLLVRLMSINAAAHPARHRRRSAAASTGLLLPSGQPRAQPVPCLRGRLPVKAGVGDRHG